MIIEPALSFFPYNQSALASLLPVGPYNQYFLDNEKSYYERSFRIVGPTNSSGASAATWIGMDPPP